MLHKVHLPRRAVLNLLAAGSMSVGLPACANAPERSIRPAIRPAQPADGLVARAGLTGDLAYSVLDIRDGTLLEGRGPNVGLPPASVAKAITALYALDALGGGYQFRTRLIATGPVRDNVLQGDLILAGGGDPTLDTDALGAMAAGLARAGVSRISGRFLVWGGALTFVPQIADDQAVQAGYNATVSGLNLNYNRVHFEWRRAGDGYNVTMDARSERFRPEVEMARMQVVSRAAPLYTFARQGERDEWTVARNALGNSGSRWLPVRQPELYAGDAFRSLARAQGVVLPAPAKTGQPAAGGAVLAEHLSRPLVDLIRDTLRFSTNISAEAIGLAASAARGVQPATLEASAARMNDWARQRYGMASARLVDHSGLGARSSISMTDLARMFHLAGSDGALRGLLREHPFRDSSGRLISAPGLDVRAKTGTLYFVSALGGYVRAPGGRELAFAICAADLPRRSAVAGSSSDRPEGTAQWAGRARMLHQEMLQRWAQTYS